MITRTILTDITVMFTTLNFEGQNANNPPSVSVRSFFLERISSAFWILVAKEKKGVKCKLTIQLLDTDRYMVKLQLNNETDTENNHSVSSAVSPHLTLRYL